MKSAIALLAILLWGVATPVYGQEFRAQITGQVTDPTGAGIPGATVTAVQVDTRQAYTAKSDAAGAYSLLYLLPGKYTVTMEAPGFQKTAYNNVTLESAQKLNLNATLAVGTIDQQVTVTAAPGLLETGTASVGGVVDQTKVENMPSTGRQVWMDLAFTQGVRMTSGQFDTTARNNGDRFTVNGSPTDSNAYYLNGAPVSDSGTWDIVPNQDAVQELQGGTAYDAQYGHAAGGSFNVNVKSGSNRLHGTVYDYYGNEALNANFTQSNLAGIRKGVNIRNIFGANAGGPVRKDKTFFFGSYEGFRQTYPSSVTQSVPPLAWHTGDFAGSGYNIFDPLTTFCAKSNAAGQCSQYSRQQFPNNLIPASRISPIGQAIVNLYPAPTAPGSANNRSAPGVPRDFAYDQYIGRVDQYFSENTRAYGLFTTQQHDQSHGPGNVFNNAGDTRSFPTAQRYTAIADVTRVLSPSMVADVKLSFTRLSNFNVHGVAVAQNFTGDKIGGLSMPLVASTTHANIVPEIDVTSFAQVFDNQQNGSVDNNWDFNASLTQTKGLHNLHYGFEFLDVQSGTSGIPGQPNGVFNFSPLWTQGNPLAASKGQGVGIASLLLGYPNSGSVAWNSHYFTTYHYYGAFIQDDFKLRRNVTINLGLRWDVNKSPSERYDRINAGFCFTCANPYASQVTTPFPVPLTGGLLFAGVGQPDAPFDVQWNNWQPRFGISWAITPRTVLRAGYGIYYSWGRQGTNSIGFNQSTPYIDSLDGNLTPTNSFRSGHPYPNGVQAPAGSSLGLATQAGQGITFDSMNRKIPFSQHWSIGIQRELPKRTLLEIEYAGSHTHGIAAGAVSPTGTALDVIPVAEQAACYADNAVCNTNVPNPFYGVLPVTTPLGSSATIQQWQLTRPWPLFNGITENQNPAGESDYHALQVRVERKLATLDFVFNYVYSNWMEETDFLNNGSFRDAKLWRGLDSADRRHYVNLNAVWPLPFGKGGAVARNASGFLSAVISHWLVDSTILWGSGTPLAIPAADFYGPGCTSFAPQGGQNAAHWINNDMSCWHNLLPWEARTNPLRVGYLRNPGLFMWNPAIHKRFALPWEGKFVQFRMEAINGPNHPTFGAPAENINVAPSLTPWRGWVGFGTLPFNQGNPPRVFILSLKVIF